MRTLERKLGALCRAVAVRVAEMNLKKSSEETNLESITDENVGELHNNVTSDGGVGGLACPLPPQLPILLDEAALEDILGVRYFVYLILINN